jgi:glycosyltransferase involved in cell wall biosynthesis
MVDAAPVLGSVDIYLNSFPTSNNAGVLDAMAAGKPVVTMKQTGELVAAEELTAANEAEYFEIADRLVHTPSLRAALGQTMKDRFQAEFRPSRLGERYVAFLNRLLESRKSLSAEI